MSRATTLSKSSLRIAVLCLLLVAGCDEQASGFLERFVAACGDSSNMPDLVCECLGRAAQKDLTLEARTFLLSSLEGDEAAAEKARNELGVPEAMQAGMFMTQAEACAAELDASGASVP